MSSILAGWLSVEGFGGIFHFPIQVVRTMAAILITAGMFLSIRFLEKESQQQIAAAQKLHLEMIEQREALRRDLLRHTVLAQEDERARIARELHDEMAQILTAFSLDLAKLQNIIPSTSSATTVLIRMQDLVHQMSQGMVRLVTDLRPAHLDDLGLIPALQYMLDNQFRARGMEIDLRLGGDLRRVDPLIETVLFRIVQEALVNVQRHAQTNWAQVCLTFDPEQIHLLIRDHGVGFNPSQDFSSPLGWGLAGMRERAESLGSLLEITSQPGQGTQIETHIYIPAFPLEIGGGDGGHSTDVGG
jgi:signal transduction histidine kinase